MKTKLDEIAAKARKETKLVFTSLAHHITKELVWNSLNNIPNNSAPGVDGIDVSTAKKDFPIWIDKMIQSVHNQGYKAPPVKRVWIPKPGKTEKRPLGIPCMADKALQRSTSIVLSAIYEQDFLPCSFGGRPKLSAHNALSTLNEIISEKKVGWVYEADLKNFFGSLNHEWIIRFVKHRVQDPRILSLIQRWLKAGVLENDQLQHTEYGTPQGGSVSVLISNIYLHYVLDLWFAKVVKRKLRGEAYLIRYIDDFLVCFQYRSDAYQFQDALKLRLAKFSLVLEPNKTQLVEFGRFAQKHAKERGEKTGTIYFLGFTHYCSRTSKGNFMVGRKTEKSRLRRSIEKLTKLMREVRHYRIREQAMKINQVLIGHYNYYGMGGNYQSLDRIYNHTQKYWRRMLNSRSRKSYVSWDKFELIKKRNPLQKPKLIIPFSKMRAYATVL